MISLNYSLSTPSVHQNANTKVKTQRPQLIQPALHFCNQEAIYYQLDDFQYDE